ncbi:hypothetical protein ACFVUH_23305 [Kitasatospora sp. NPDC058032]|uniref:hypothetical protein n=1 Tax=Kitasatospora sp. NPDC058032 TaxID=3346307 RepID=UPI0036D97095
MGYDLHITRRGYWWDEEGSDISAAEWEGAVTADPGLVVVPLPEGCPERVVELVLRKGGESSGEPLWWRAGQIWAKNPTDAMVATMCRLAKALSARVQGDDGEHYDM